MPRSSILDRVLHAVRAEPRWPIGLVLLATLGVYARSLGQGFVWDDGPALIHNSLFNPPTPHTLSFYWTHPAWNLYQPLTCTLWAACAKAGYIATADEYGVHLSALPFHLLNVSLHLLATFGVYRLLRTLRLELHWAAIGAAVFGLHPLQVESVAFAGQLNTPLFGCLAVFALDDYLQLIAAPTTEKRSSLYVRGTILYLLAMFAQPVALITPVVAVVLDRLTNRRPWRATLRPAWPWFAMAVPFAIVTKLSQHGLAAAAQSPWRSRPLVALDNLAWQTLHFMWPVGLTVDYGRSPAMLLAHPAQWLTGILTLALAAVAWRLRKHRPLTTAGFAVAAIALLPSSGIVPFDFEEFSAVADRHAYFALIGFALVIVDTLQQFPVRPARAGIIVVLVVFGAMTVRQVGFWKNDATLFGRGVALNPRSGLCQENLAAAQMVSDPRAAMDHFARAIAIHPQNAGTYDNYAMAAMNAGDPVAAVAQLQQGLRIAPANAGLHSRLADAFDLLGRRDEAAAERATARRIDNRPL